MLTPRNLAILARARRALAAALAATVSAGGLAGILVAAGTAPPVHAADDPTLVNKIVLRINDRIATLRDYERRKTELEQAILAREDLTLQQRRDAMNELGLRVYRQIYEELLLLSRADQLAIRITEDDVDEEIVRMRGQMGLSSQQEFERALEATGLTVAELREQTKKSLLTQTVIGREVYGRMNIDEEILRRYYRDHPDQFTVPERYRLREIVVLEDGGLELSERLRLAAQLHQEILGGRTLDEIAEAQSAGGATSSLIDLGWVSAADLTPELRDAVETLETGAVSAPVEARGGSHLLEMVEREAAYLRPFSEVIDDIRLIERQRRSIAEIEKFFTKLEDEAYVILEPPAEAEGFRGLTRGAGDDAGVPPLLAAPQPAPDEPTPDAPAPDEPAAPLAESATGPSDEAGSASGPGGAG